MVMSSLIDLDHVRRGLRLFRIILRRFGVDFFLKPGQDGSAEMDSEQVCEIIDVIADWLHRCTGIMPNNTTQNIIHREAKRIVNAEYKEKRIRESRSQ
jgi:hypothetical protein